MHSIKFSESQHELPGNRVECLLGLVQWFRFFPAASYWSSLCLLRGHQVQFRFHFTLWWVHKMHLGDVSPYTRVTNITDISENLTHHKLLFPGSFIGRRHRPPTLDLLLFEQVERGHCSVFLQQLQVALLHVFRRTRHLAQVQRDGTWR